MHQLPIFRYKILFVLNLLYRPFFVNLLLFIFINIIFIANCCILFWYIRPITQFADSTKDFISCPYAKRTKRPSLERPSCVLHTCLQSFLPVPAELRQRQVGIFLFRPADAPLIVEDEQVVSPEVLHPLRIRGEVECRRICLLYTSALWPAAASTRATTSRSC